MAKRKIFLSYSRKNTAEVRNLYGRLSGAGFQPWMDVKDLLPGQPWAKTTRKAIGTSDFFLACLTKSSVNNEGFFKQELEWAVYKWKKKRRRGLYLAPAPYLIPVRLEDCEVPHILRTFQCLDLYKRGGRDRLLEALSDPLTPREVLPGLGMAAGFIVGVLGNMLADLNRQAWFSNPFAPPQAIVVILMTLAGLCAGAWAARRSLPLPRLTQFWPGRPRLTLVLAFMLLAIPAAALLSAALDEGLIRVRGCSEVEVTGLELELPAGRQQFFEREINLQRRALFNRQNLAGRALLPDLADGEECVCEWWVRTNLLPRQQLPPRSEAKDCIFSIPFQDGVTEINLTLNVGRRSGASGFEKAKYFRFKINVQ